MDCWPREKRDDSARAKRKLMTAKAKMTRMATLGVSKPTPSN